MLLILALAGTLLGTSEGADISAIKSGLPDTYRVVRAVFTIGLFMIACMGVINDISRLKLAGSGARWMMVYAFMATASAIYSVDPFITLWKGFEVMTLVLVAVSLAGQLRSVEGVRWLMNVINLLLLYIVLTVYVGLALYPGEAIKDVEYLGVRGLVPLLNPASVGSLSALLAVCVVGNIVYKLPSKKQTSGIWVVLLIAAGALILSHTRTPIFSAAVAIIIMLVLGRHYRLMFLTVLVSTVLIFAMSLDSILEYIYRGQTHESFVGLTGRTYYWEEKIWPMVLLSPVIGYGYYAAQRVHFVVNSIDNAYLEVLLGLGFIGLSVFLIPVFLTMKVLMRTRPRGAMPVANKLLWAQIMGIFLIIIIRALTGVAFQVQHPLLVFYMMTLIGTAALLRLNNEKKSAEVVADTKEINKTIVLYRKGPRRVVSNRIR
jgi:O-antigen ligase